MAHEKREFGPTLSRLIRMGRVYAQIERLNQKSRDERREAEARVAPYVSKK